MGEFLAQQVEVDGALQRAVCLLGLGDAVREEFSESCGVGGDEVRGLKVEFHGKDEG